MHDLMTNMLKVMKDFLSSGILKFIVTDGPLKALSKLPSINTAY